MGIAEEDDLFRPPPRPMRRVMRIDPPLPGKTPPPPPPPPEIDFRQAKAHVLLDHDQVATGRQFETTAVGQAVDGGNGRLGEVVELAVDLVLVAELFLHHVAGGDVGRELADVGTGAEGPLTGAPDHENADARVFGQGLETFVEGRGSSRGSRG